MYRRRAENPRTSFNVRRVCTNDGEITDMPKSEKIRIYWIPKFEFRVLELRYYINLFVSRHTIIIVKLSKALNVFLQFKIYDQIEIGIKKKKILL